MITMPDPTETGFPNRLPHKTILVVDDDDAVRRGLRRVLVTKDYQVIDARDGREAIRLSWALPRSNI